MWLFVGCFSKIGFVACRRVARPAIVAQVLAELCTLFNERIFG